MSLKIVVYSKSACPQCESAKMLLKTRSLAYEEIKIDDEAERMARSIEQSLTDSLIYCDLGTPIESGFSYTDCSVQARSVMATDLTSGNVKQLSAFYGVRGADVAST